MWLLRQCFTTALPQASCHSLTADCRTVVVCVPVLSGYEAETVAAADRDLKDALGPLAYVVSGGQEGDKGPTAPQWLHGHE